MGSNNRTIVCFVSNNCSLLNIKQMFNIGEMNLGEIVKGVLEEKNIKIADLVRRINTLSPETDITTLDSALRLLIKRDSNSSKYLQLIAKALNYSVDELVNWVPEEKRIEQSKPRYGSEWPFGERVTKREYDSLDDDQKELIICRILTYLDENRMKSITKSKNKASN